MKLSTLRLVPLILAFGACAQQEPTESSPQVASEVSDAALRIEQAERQLDRGGDAAEARKLLEEALATSDITLEERSRATVALSRAYEALGDREKAISVIEKELASHDYDENWADEPFEKRLFKLLTG